MSERNCKCEKEFSTKENEHIDILYESIIFAEKAIKMRRGSN